MMPGVQLAQYFARWGCGTVRYAITEEMLLLSEMVRMFLGNFTVGWDERSESKIRARGISGPGQ